MKLYALNNIVSVGESIYFIDIIGERIHLKNERHEGLRLYGINICKDETDLIEDIEISEWLLSMLFKKEKDGIWVIDKLANEGVIDFPYYTIERDESGEAYMFKRGGNFVMYIDYVRELQNAYHFFRDIEEGDFLNDDIDEKIKKLYNLI